MTKRNVGTALSSNWPSCCSMTSMRFQGKTGECLREIGYHSPEMVVNSLRGGGWEEADLGEGGAKSGEHGEVVETRPLLFQSNDGLQVDGPQNEARFQFDSHGLCEKV